jgi:hypothetical protein
VAGRFSDVVGNMRDVLPGTPPWLVTAIYWIVPNFHNFDFKTRVAYGDFIPWPELGWVSLYAVVYLGFLLTLGLWLFRRRDLA